jgi:hypothetical protein
MNIQLHEPLTLSLSPSDGARESNSAVHECSPNGPESTNGKSHSLAPSDGERARVRGSFSPRLIAKAAALLIAAWMAPSLVAASFTDWTQRAPLEVSAPGLVRVSLTPQILDASQPGLEDLRLADPNGNEVPILIQKPMPEPVVVRAARSFQSTLRGNTTLLTVETGFDTPIEAITLETADFAFIKPVRVEGSADGRNFTLLADGAPIFRQAGASDLSARFPSGTWAWLRLTVDDARSRPVAFTGAQLRAARGAEPPLEPVAVTIRSREESDGNTRLVLDLGAANLTLAQLDFDTSEPLFQRRVSVRTSELTGDDIRENELATAVIYSGSMGQTRESRRTSLHLDRLIPARELIVVIANGNSPPLPLNAVRASRRPVHFLFQARGPGQHQLHVGNPRCPAPRYDLAGLAGELKNAPAMSLTPGIVSANPEYRRPDTMPGLAETGAALETREWRFRKAVTLQRPGVQQLELDLDVLAHARTDLGDLRLVRDGKQVPYLIERPSLTRALLPDVATDNDPKRPSFSRWKLKLSQANLPLIRLESRSTAPLFQRSVRVWEELPDERGGRHQRDFGHAQWQRTAESKDDALIVPLSGRSQSEVIFLETDNGDNPPLELGNFKVVYSVTRLVFKCAEAPVLYYGNVSARAPRYDLALVGQQLLAAEKSPAAAGVEEALKKQAWTEGEPLTGIRGWIFWGILAAVVVGLLIVIARLLPKPAK